MAASFQFLSLKNFTTLTFIVFATDNTASLNSPTIKLIHAPITVQVTFTKRTYFKSLTIDVNKRCNFKNTVTNPLMPTPLFRPRRTYSAWYTSDLHVVTNVVIMDIYAFVSPWHQRLYPGVKENNLECL